MSKYKKTDPLFSFLEGQMHLNQSVYIPFFFYSFAETIFKTELNKFITKSTDTLTFNFSHTIYPEWDIIPLHQNQKQKIMRFVLIIYLFPVVRFLPLHHFGIRVFFWNLISFHIGARVIRKTLIKFAGHHTVQRWLREKIILWSFWDLSIGIASFPVIIYFWTYHVLFKIFIFI